MDRKRISSRIARLIDEGKTATEERRLPGVSPVVLAKALGREHGLEDWLSERVAEHYGHLGRGWRYTHVYRTRGGEMVLRDGSYVCDDRPRALMLKAWDLAEGDAAADVLIAKADDLVRRSHEAERRDHEVERALRLAA